MTVRGEISELYHLLYEPIRDEVKTDFLARKKTRDKIVEITGYLPSIVSNNIYKIEAKIMFYKKQEEVELLPALIRVPDQQFILLAEKGHPIHEALMKINNPK